MYTNPATDHNNINKNRKKILHNQTIELRTNKENGFDTAVGVATSGGRGHELINNNLNTVSELISCLSQGDDNIWSSLEQF